MRVEGAASTWVNAVLEEVATGHRPAFQTWGEFEHVMIHRFKPLTQVEEARKQLKALTQTKGVSGYVQRFQDIHSRLPGMTQKEADHAFLDGL